MTVKQIIESNPDAAFIEVYHGDKLHTDYCEIIEDYSSVLTDEAKTFEVMDRAEYQRTILANSNEDVNLIADFDLGDALVILV